MTRALFEDRGHGVWARHVRRPKRFAVVASYFAWREFCRKRGFDTETSRAKDEFGNKYYLINSSHHAWGLFFDDYTVLGSMPSLVEVLGEVKRRIIQ